MDSAEFDRLVDGMFDACKEKLRERRNEYAIGKDRLHNFKQAAALRRLPVEEVLAGMMVKHTVSIYDFLRELTQLELLRPMEKWDEKIVDQINYLLLLRAALQDRYAKEREHVHPSIHKNIDGLEGADE